MPDPDWSTVDIDQLEQQWQLQLDASYKLTVDSLGQAAIESRDLLPILDQAVASLSQLHHQYTVYCEQLAAMAAAVNAIQETNIGLTRQSTNQRAILSVLDSMPCMHNSTLSVDLDLDKADQVGRVADQMALLQEALDQDDPDLAGMLATRQHRQQLEEERDRVCQMVFAGFAKSVGAGMTIGLDSRQVSFLRVYQPIFAQLKTLQIHLNNHLSASLSMIIEEIINNHLVGGNTLQEDLQLGHLHAATPTRSFLSSLTADFDSPLIESASSMWADQLIIIPESTVDYGRIKMFDLDELPILGKEDKLTVLDAVHYVLLQVARWLDLMSVVLEGSFGGGKVVEAVSLQLPERLMVLCELDLFMAFVAVEERLAECDQTNCCLTGRLETIKSALQARLDQLLADCLNRSIKQYRHSLKRRSNSVLPMVQMVDRLYKHYGRFENGQVSRWLSTVCNAVLKHLALYLSLSVSVDEKEQLNGAVLVIQSALWLEQSGEDIKEKAIGRYVELNLPKVFGDRLSQYLSSFLLSYQQQGRSVAFKPDYGKSSMRRLLAGQSAKDTLNGVEYVKSRVQKHFGVDWEAVWQEVVSELKARVKTISSAIGEVYGEDLLRECGSVFSLPVN